MSVREVPAMTEPKAQAQTQAQTQPLAVRARMYAALGEPVRLQIVDHLTYGDASPASSAR